MIVSCPQCATGYVLPESLIGPGGARVRCPGCTHEFVVAHPASPPPGPPRKRPGEPYDPPGEPEPGAPAEPAAEPGTRPERNPEIPTGPSTEPDPGDPATPFGTRHAARVAREVLGELSQRSGTRLDEAATRGQLFTEHGPALIDAWDEFVRRAGPGAPSAAFREALRERWGVELSPALQPDPD